LDRSDCVTQAGKPNKDKIVEIAYKVPSLDCNFDVNFFLTSLIIYGMALSRKGDTQLTLISQSVYFSWVFAVLTSEILTEWNRLSFFKRFNVYQPINKPMTNNIITKKMRDASDIVASVLKPVLIIIRIEEKMKNKGTSKIKYLSHKSDSLKGHL
jgi:hypothetical protein